jgi:hypothetical protein
MKLAHLCAAFAIACAVFTFGAVASNAPPAAAQYVIDRDVVHAGADRVVLQAPSEEPSAEIARATYTSAPIDGEIVWSWGDWLADALQGLLTFAGLAALYLMRRLPKVFIDALDAFGGMMGQGRADALIEKAIGFGINTTAGAVRGKTLTVKVGNQVMERALEYAVRHAPKLAEKIGGIAGVREKIIARLELDADAELPAPRPPVSAGLVEAVTPAPAPAG